MKIELRDDPANFTVEVEGESYLLSAYPAAHLEMLEELGFATLLEKAEELELSSTLPEFAVKEYKRPWSRGSAYVNGRFARVITVKGCDTAIGIGPGSNGPSIFSFGAESECGCDDYEVKSDLQDRLHWLEQFGAVYTLSWRQADSGDGVFLDHYLYDIIIHDAHAEAAFLQKFGGAA